MSNLDSIAKNDIRARELLATKIGNKGALMIWPDEQRAYLDEQADYVAAAEALGVVVDDVDSALWDEYEAATEQAAELIKNETEQREDVNDGSQRESWLHTWEGKDGWYYCFSGINRDNLYSEGEDVGPFDSRKEASESARSAMEVED